MTRVAIYQGFVSAREGPKELSQPTSKPSVRVRVVFLPTVDHILQGKRRALLGAAPALVVSTATTSPTVTPNSLSKVAGRPLRAGLCARFSDTYCRLVFRSRWTCLRVTPKAVARVCARSRTWSRRGCTGTAAAAGRTAGNTPRGRYDRFERGMLEAWSHDCEKVRLRSLRSRCRGRGCAGCLAAAVDGFSDTARTGLAWGNEEPATDGACALREARNKSI